MTQLSRVGVLPCPSIVLTTSQAPRPKVSTRPPPHATCASSGDGHTCAEAAVPASGNWGSPAIARRSFHSWVSSCPHTEPTCRARAAQYAAATPPAGAGAGECETRPAQQSPAHVQAVRQSAAGAISWCDGESRDLERRGLRGHVVAAREPRPLPPTRSTHVWTNPTLRAARLRECGHLPTFFPPCNCSGFVQTTRDKCKMAFSLKENQWCFLWS